ncbi:MAG: prephenate dehydratase [Armatimonadota bacterium]|nr:prephenate dehydratase [Armatimonadota bacterium]
MRKLSELRRQIDEIDEQLLRLLNERAALAKQIGEIKSRNAKPFFTPEREQMIYRRLQRLNRGPLTQEQIIGIFREIISISRALEKPPTVAYWGPEGTFTHMAALKCFGRASRYIPYDSIPDVFAAVERADAEYGVVPIENSLAGVVPETLDMFPQTNARICAEVYVPIAHHLLSKAKSLDQIKRVYAGSQPLQQCRRWLRLHLPAAEIVETAPTAKAVKLAAEDPNGAAIGNALAAEIYGVPILHEHIQDNPHNRTRFLVLGYNEPAPTGNDKTSLMFALRHRPGELYRALGAFYKYNVNLTMIESRPNPRGTFEYLFYVDLQGHRQDPPIKAALEELDQLAREVVILGSYPAAE